MSDIKFRLGLDGKEFDQGLDRAKKKATAWGDSMADIERKTNRAFGAGDGAKAFLAGLGIGSIEKVVELITSGYKAAVEHAKELAEWTGKSLSAVQRLITLRRTDEQNLAGLQQDQRRDTRGLVSAKNDLAFSVGANPEAQKQVAELTATIQERAIEIATLQKKIDEAAKQRAKELGDAKEKLGEAQKATAREGMNDAERLRSLDMDRAKYGLASLNSKTTELERTKAATKEAEIQKEMAALRKKISEDEARIAEKAANETKRRREEMEKLTEKIGEAHNKELAANQAIKDARGEQFAFTLGDAAQGTRGSRGGGRAAKLIGQKTGLMNQILDRGDFQVAFGDDGKPTLTSRDPSKRDAARQATGRFRSLYNDREGLRGSINNLTASDKDPFASQVKAYQQALDESKTLEAMKKALEGKFRVQQ